VEAVHLRATDLALLTRRFQNLGDLRLLCALFVHIAEYTATALTPATLAGGLTAFRGRSGLEDLAYAVGAERL
jgi:hypothetical protein